MHKTFVTPWERAGIEALMLIVLTFGPVVRNKESFSCPLGSWVSLWNFETIRGSMMKPKWQKLASLAQEICTL